MIGLTKYKAIDLCLFTFLVFMAEAVNIFMIRRVFTSHAYTLSVSIVLSMVVVFRWGWWGMLPALLSSVATVAFNGGGGLHYLIYGLGSAGVGIGILIIKLLGHKKIQQNDLLTIIYVLSGFLSVIILRSFFALTINPNLINNFVQHCVLESLNVVIGVALILILKRQNGLFEYQLDYLKRLEEERLQTQVIKRGI